MSRLRLAVLGAGHLGRIHVRLARQLEQVDFVGVADPLDTACHQVATEFGVATTTDYRTLLGRIDAAIVAVPTQLHHAVALDLLEQGIHVLVEKPITSTLAQADELVAAARGRDCVLQVGHVERFNPALTAAAAQVRSPKYIEAVRCSGYTFRSTDIGVVLDLMIHDLDVALSLARSEVVDVQALGISVFGRHEDMAQARLTFANGCVANLSASRASFVPQRSMQIFGDRAYAAIDFGGKKARVVRPAPGVLERTIDFEALPIEEKLRLKDVLFQEVLLLEELPVEDRNAIADEQLDFVSSIRQNRAPRVTGQQARDVLAVADRILDQIAAHAWNGATDGPVGPLASPSMPSVLRGPHWPAELRRAS